MANHIPGSFDPAESLPDNCPPGTAYSPDGSKTFYRLVSTFPPTERDFYSWQKLKPEKKYEDPCLARAVSLYDTKKHCANILNLPMHANQIMVGIVLTNTSGMINQTESHHYSWWLSNGFDPAPYCQKA